MRLGLVLPSECKWNSHKEAALDLLNPPRKKFTLLGSTIGGHEHPVYFKPCETCRGELGDHQVCLSTSCCFSSPITWRAETPLASSRAKRHFKCALQRGHGLCSQSILRGSFEGNLSSEPLVAARCLFVCLNPFYSLLATVLRWRWRWGGAPPAEVSLQKVQNSLQEYSEFFCICGTFGRQFCYRRASCDFMANCPFKQSTVLPLLYCRLWTVS